MHPLLAIGLLGGVFYWAKRSERRRARASSAATAPAALATTPTGFFITTDCKRFVVTDDERFSDTVRRHYRDQKLAHLAPNDPPTEVPRAMMVNFFDRYAGHCPGGSFSPTNQHPSLSQRLMQLYVYIALVAEAANDGLITEADGAQLTSEANKRVLNQATASDWQEVFQGTVGVPAELQAGVS
ncbi:MAG: hypothetical protein KAJ42_17275 [Gemmatimonadetes bacterium]|nr:hypothetical protein [Gemmatimonadota bacterium]